VSSRVKTKQANRIVREQLAAEQRRRRTWIVSIAAAAVLVLAGVVGVAVYLNQAPPQSYAIPGGTTSDHTGMQVSSGPVPVDIYLDYLCPNCKRFEDGAQSTLDDLAAKKRITLVYHPIAILDRNTNPPGYSTRAGSAAGCASDAGKFLDYTKALYAKQPAEGSAGLTDDELVSVGTGIGLTDSTFASCVRAEKYADWMAHDTDTAASKNINGTPTVLVNGRSIAPTATALLSAVGG
jgi:protein-disulfide isomerase